MCADLESSPLPEREKALLRFVERLNRAPAASTRAHVDALKALGWSDEAIFDAVTVCSLFNFFNRWIDGNGVPDTPPGFYAARLEQSGDFAYG